MKKLLLQFLLMSVVVLARATQQTVTIPANGIALVGCQINGTGGNSVNNTSFLQVQVPASFPGNGEVTMLVWECGNYIPYYYFNSANSPTVGAGWFDAIGNPANVVWNPGEGMVFENTANSCSFTLNGTTPSPVLPPANYCGCGRWSLLSCQTNSTASTYQQVTGFAPESGSEVSFNYTNTTLDADTYINGSWTPATPILTNGQAAFFYVPCETNGCITILSTNVLIYAPCNTNCVTVPLTASAIDTCCSNVALQYYLGSTFLSATNTCFSVGTTNTIMVVAADGCGNAATNTFSVTVLAGTNCGCCGPGVGAQTIQWLEGSLSTSSFNNVVLSATTCGSWLVTNLPCYGRVLITETFPGNVNDFNNAAFENVPNGSGDFVNIEPGYGPYNWGYCPAFDFINTFTSGSTFAANLDWTLNFYFLDGPPRPCTLYLDASAFAQYTLATVSQPVVFRGEYDLPGSAHTCITNNYYDPYIFLTGVTNAGKVGTVIGSYYNGDHVGDDLNTGWALFQPTAALQTTSLPQGAYASCPGFPAPATVPYLSLNVSQQPNDAIGFMIGYVCCTNPPVNCINLETPGNIVLTTCSNCIAANFSASATDLCCSNVQITYGLNGALIDTNYCFPVNSTNTIDVVAADSCGNSAANSFEVTVLPGASCATNGCITILTTNLVIYAPCSTNCVTVPLTATAIDHCCSNHVSLQYYLGGTSISSSGTCFSVNTTNTVEVVAMDGCSNTASSSFTVTVILETNPPVILSCPTNVIICTNNGAGGTGGPIIVDSDELALSVTGFSSEGDGALYATNCAAYLTRGLGKNILIYSSNSGLNNTALYYSLVYGGYTVTLVTPPTPALTESYLSAYNAVFVGGDQLTTTELQALAAYVCDGGGVYVAAGTGDIPVSNGNTPAQAEAAQWNYFLNPFGLNLADTYNSIQSLLTVGGGTLTATASPVMAGVNALDYSIGNDVSVIGGDPLAQVIAYDGTEGLIAVSGCVTSTGSGCGTMPDETGLVISSGGGTVTQSIPPGTTICSNTFVTFTVSNLCGEVTQTNVPCELINCASNGCITIDSTNVVVYAPCGSNCVIVPLTATAIDTCCSNGVSLQYYLGTTAISAADTCFTAGTTNTVEVIAVDGCGNTASGTFEVTVLPQASSISVLTTNLLAYAPCDSNCVTVPLTATVIDPCCGNNVSLRYNEGTNVISATATCFPVDSTTPVTVVATDSCGDAATNTFEVTVLPHPTYISVLGTNLFVYAPCGSNCVIVPLTAVTMGYCCSSNVSLHYNVGTTIISATDTCFSVDSTTPVTVVATDGCGDAATNTINVTVLPTAPCTNHCITILSTNLMISAPCGYSCVTVPLMARVIDTCCNSNVILQYYLGATSISATDNCFTVGTISTVEVVAMDGCGNTASSTFNVTVLSGTNCCCGPGLGPRTIQWLNLPLSTTFNDSVDLDNSTCGSWLITNLPCYGRVLVTETAPGNITDFNNQGFQNVPNALGDFVNTDTNYGPYDWTYCPGLNFVNTFTSSPNNLAWTLNFYFLDGAPNPCTLYLDASGLAQDTTATVSQPVVFRGEYDLSSSAHTCITNAAYDPYAGVTGVTNASTVGTVIGSYYNTDHSGDDFNTGWALFQPTTALPTTSLPEGAYASCPGYPAAATVPYLSLNISQQPGDGIGFNIGYVCCGASCLNLECPGSIVLTTCSNCASANFSASATDLCCSNVQISYALNGTFIDTNYCFPVNSTNTVETMAADSCGNFTSCSFTVTVLPGTNCLPCLQFNCPTNMTVECGTLWTSTPPVIIHSCCPSNSIFRLSSVTNGTCPKYITDLWRVSDSCGDTDICTQQIAVVDTKAPVITGGTNPVTGIITTNCELVIPAISVTATDSCTPECSLGQWQSPTNGTIVPGPDAYVTVTVTDLCGNATQCEVLVEGVYKRGLQVTWPTQLISTNCLVPCVNPTFVDCSCPTDEIQVAQSPECDMQIGPGQYRIHVTIKDCHGLTVETNIPLNVVAADSSFLSILFNTGIAANGSLLPECGIDPHYTLGPVTTNSPGGCTLTGYTAPDALAVNNLWPWMEAPHVSEWISPNCEPSDMRHSPYGFYTYTNRFVLPQGLIAASASISGRWAADNGGVIMFNGTATANKITSNLNPDYWTPFTINANFLAYPQVNTVLFVVTNDVRSGCSPTGLRVEYLAANACSPCSPPAIISMTTPPNPLLYGGSYTFNVQADGTPPLTYQWLFNNNTILGANSSSLRLNHITWSSAGIYTVIVSDPCGSVTNSRRISMVVPMPWTNGWWTFDEPTNPLTATFGPDLVMNDIDSGTNFSLSTGNTEDLGLPNPGGQIVNVLGFNPLWPDTLTLPPILPAGSTSNTDYTVIMDIYQPDTSVGTPSTLFESAGDGSGVALTLDVTNYLDITGTAGGVPFDVTSTMPMSADSWHRLALVVTGPVAGIGGSVIGYLDGEPFNTEPIYPFNCPCCPLNINSAIYYLTNPPIILSGTNGTLGNGELYVSSVQFHTVAFAPQIISALSAPDSGPLPNISNVTPPASAAPLSASAVNGTVNFTWQGGGYVLQETTDLTSGEWADSDLPFTETQMAGGSISTTAVVNPSPAAPAKFYRLVFRP